MRSRSLPTSWLRAAALAWPVTLAACSTLSPPAPDGTAPAETHAAAVVPDPTAVTAALRDYVYAYYDLRLAPEAGRERALAALSRARERLDREAGPLLAGRASAGTPMASAPESGELDSVAVDRLVEYLAGHDLVFLPTGRALGQGGSPLAAAEAGGSPGRGGATDTGVRLVRVLQRRKGRYSNLPTGDEFFALRREGGAYRVIEFGEVLVEDFAGYSGQLSAAAVRPMYVGEGILFLDRPLLEQTYGQVFLNRLERYRRLEGLWEATGGQGAGLAEAKDYARWLALRGAGFQGSEGDGSGGAAAATFADYYAAQLEARGAALLVLNERMKSSTREAAQTQEQAAGMTPWHLAQPHLVQMAAADPRFALADVLGESALGLPSASAALEALLAAAGTQDPAVLVGLPPERLVELARQALAEAP